LPTSENRSESGTSGFVPKLKYTAVYEWIDEGYWEVGLIENTNLHGYGATLSEARNHICEVLVIMSDSTVDSPDLVEDVRLPEPIASLVARAWIERKAVRQLRHDEWATQQEQKATTAKAVVVTRKAAKLLAEHADWMEVDANSLSPTTDVRLPDIVSATVGSANEAVQLVHRDRMRSRGLQKAAAVATAAALRSNREAARLLVHQLRLTAAEAGGFLNLSSERVEQLLDG